ncbi:hypothetical protein Tco_1071210 [Tanacetum coccineum]|uniref:Uncharacterized protein n=1 Tax=Tanacetum coccineum TaxID=301880 RepID=A0ABQ5HNN9_9ASTR
MIDVGLPSKEFRVTRDKSRDDTRFGNEEDAESEGQGVHVCYPDRNGLKTRDVSSEICCESLLLVYAHSRRRSHILGLTWGACRNAPNEVGSDIAVLLLL